MSEPTTPQPTTATNPTSPLDPSLLHEPPSHPYGLAASYPPAAGHAPAAYPSAYAPAYAPAALSSADCNWAVAAHLSGFVAAFIALGFLGPLVVLFTEGQRRPFVRRHAVEALNFNLSILLWLVISAVLMFVLVGFLMVAAVGILYLVASILGALAASRGEDFRYPLTIRFVS